MVKRCYICRRRASKRDRVSLFALPKDPIARHKWMKACGLLPSDNLKGICICSIHFSTKHVDRGNQFQTRCTLKVGAVPSIGVPNPICFNNENADTLNDGTENNMETKTLQQIIAHSKETKMMSNNIGKTQLINMVRKCIVCGSSYKRDGDTSFHLFPDDFKTRKLWMNCLNLTSEDFSMTFNYVCAKHFSPDCYEKKNGQSILKNNGIPKLFPKEDVKLDISRKVLSNGNPENVNSDDRQSSISSKNSKNINNLVETIRTVWIPDEVTLLPSSPNPSNHLETKSTKLEGIKPIETDSKTPTTSHSSSARLTTSSPKVSEVTPSDHSRGKRHVPEKSSSKERLPRICQNTKFQNPPRDNQPPRVVVIKQTSQDEEPPQNIIFRPRQLSQENGPPPLTPLLKQEKLPEKEERQNPEGESSLKGPQFVSAKETSQKKTFQQLPPGDVQSQNKQNQPLQAPLGGAPQIIIINLPSQGQIMPQNNIPHLLAQGKEPPPLALQPPSGGAALNGTIQQLIQGKGTLQEVLQQLIQNKEQPQNRIFQQLSSSDGPTQNGACYVIPQKEVPPHKAILLPAPQGKTSAGSGTVYLLPQTEVPSAKTLLLVPQGNEPAQNRVVQPLPLNGTQPQNNMFYSLPQGEGQQQKTILFQLLQGNVPAQDKTPFQPFPPRVEKPQNIILQQFPLGQPPNIIQQVPRREEPTYKGTQNKTFCEPPQTKQPPQSITLQHITREEKSQGKKKTVTFQEPSIMQSQKNIVGESVTDTIQERLQDERMPPQNEAYHQFPLSNRQVQSETSQYFSHKEVPPQKGTVYFQEPDKYESYRQIKEKYRRLVKKLVYKNMEIKRLQQQNRRYKLKIENLNDIVGVLERNYKECINERKHRKDSK